MDVTIENDVFIMDSPAIFPIPYASLQMERTTSISPKIGGAQQQLQILNSATTTTNDVATSNMISRSSSNLDNWRLDQEKQITFMPPKKSNSNDDISTAAAVVALEPLDSDLLGLLSPTFDRSLAASPSIESGGLKSRVVSSDELSDWTHVFDEPEKNAKESSEIVNTDSATLGRSSGDPALKVTIPKSAIIFSSSSTPPVNNQKSHITPPNLLVHEASNAIRSDHEERSNEVNNEEDNEDDYDDDDDDEDSSNNEEEENDENDIGHQEQHISSLNHQYQDQKTMLSSSQLIETTKRKRKRSRMGGRRKGSSYAGCLYPRPRGRAPKGRVWDGDHGIWALHRKAQVGINRPRGRAPLGQVWNSEVGMWIRQGGNTPPPSPPIPNSSADHVSSSLSLQVQTAFSNQLKSAMSQSKHQEFTILGNIIKPSSMDHHHHHHHHHLFQKQQHPINHSILGSHNRAIVGST